MIGKIVASLVSMLLVVGIVVALISSQEDSKKDHNPSNAMKAVTSFCAPTTYKDACATSLGAVARNQSATSKDFLLAAFDATMAEIKRAKTASKNMTINKQQDLFNYNSIEECKEMLDFAVDQLQASYSEVGDSEMHTLADRVDELLNWLSAVYAYQTTCLDNFVNPEIKKPIEASMLNATQLTHNAISIVADIKSILQAFNISIPPIPEEGNDTSRKLIDVSETVHEEYPSWLSDADRRLLAQQAGRGGHHKGGGGHHKGRGIKPNVIVAKDGSGQYKTINQALQAYPSKLHGRFIIYIKAGIYDEKIIIDKNKPFVFMYGDGAGKTIITGNDNVAIKKSTTSTASTVVAIGTGFIVRGLTMRNTAGPEGEQAPALRIQGDMSAVIDCSIEGYQDTLYYHTMRQFYRNCVISGTVDFIFGKGTAVIQNSVIIVRKPGQGQANTITADGREAEQTRTGLTLQNCKIVPETALAPTRFQVKTYLGRPWKAYSTTAVIKSEIGDFVRPEGWMQWQGLNYHQTANYVEFGNFGPGSGTSRRDRSFKKWHLMSQQEAYRYTPAPFLGGNYWIRQTGAPVTLGL